MLTVSVIICTHNPRRDYLSRTLEGLRQQDIYFDQWELLLVDNASTEPLTTVDLSWHPQGRYVFEPTLGLTSARQRGIRESASDLLVFIDDDNVLASDYLSVALAIARQHPQLGAWGGSVLAEYETPPSVDVGRHAAYLAIRPRSRETRASSMSVSDAI